MLLNYTKYFIKESICKHLQRMDLSEQIYVQCINCHSNIFESSQNHSQEIQGPICEHCLFYQSKLINQKKQQLATLEYQISTIKNQKSKAGISSKQITGIAQYNQKQIDILNQQLQRLIDQEKKLDNTQRELSMKFNRLCQKYEQAETHLEAGIQQYGDKVCQLDTLSQKQSKILIEIRQLRIKKQNLLGFSVLMQIYQINFDDEYAFINGEAATIDNLGSLLEILSYLIKKYNYPFCQINSTENEIILNKQNSLVLQKSKPPQVKKWVTILVKQTLGLWKHIKQVCSLQTKQNYDFYVLPFKIILDPQLSINGKLLTPEKGYASFLKYFTHNIKYIISFDFDVELRSIGKWQPSRSYGLKSMDD